MSFALFFFFILLGGQQIVTERLVKGHWIRWSFTGLGPLTRNADLAIAAREADSISLTVFNETDNGTDKI